jgi:L-iditol 2-dehydrogenase
MRAAVLTEPGRVEVREVPMPELHDEVDVLIRTQISSICGSDLHQIHHEWRPTEIRPPGFPCHETVGIVVESRSPLFSPGDRVLGVPPLLYASGFAEYQALPSSFLIEVEDEGVSSSDVALAQQLGTTIYAFKRFWPAGRTGRTAAIIGAGSAGLGFTTVCRMAGFERIVVSDLHAHRTEAARALGATDVVTGESGIVEAVMDITGGAGADLVIEAAGRNLTRLQAFEAVKVEGDIGWFGMNEGEDFLIPFKEVFRRKPTISMRWDAQTEEGHSSFRQALDWIVSGEVDTSAYRMREFTIEDTPRALASAADPSDGFIKGGVVFA